MLAARDQENLVHGHLAAAASKPLNQTRQLPPKTPSNKVPKTPFKIPLNDENANGGLGGGKATLKTKGDGKNALVTPMATRNRAPLGAKTTNARAKVLQTPAPQTNGDLGKTKKSSLSAQKSKPKPKPAERTKLEVLGDLEEDDVPDIEYMPPRPQNLPDLPDDHVELDLSMFQGNIFEGAAQYYYTKKGYDGLSQQERDERREATSWALAERKLLAKLQLQSDSLPMPCLHSPECPGEECRDMPKIRQEAQEAYEREIAIIDAEAAPKKMGKSPGKAAPSTKESKIVASAPALSKPKATTRVKDPVKKPLPSAAKSRLTTSMTTVKKSTVPPPSTLRHKAAIANSRTTLGPSKGRAVSSTLKKQTTPQKTGGFVPYEERDNDVAPGLYWQRYGTPPLGSDMWTECWKCGFLREGRERGDTAEREEDREREEFLMKTAREDALEDFQLTLGE